MASSSKSTSFSFSSPSTPEQPRVPNASPRGTASAMTSGSAVGVSLIVRINSIADTRPAPPSSSTPPPPVDTQARQPVQDSRAEDMEGSKIRSGRKYQGRRSRKSTTAPSAAGPTISESHSDRAGVDSESMHIRISVEDSEDSEEHLDEHARMPTSSYQQRFYPSFSSSSSPAPTSSASYSSLNTRMVDRQNDWQTPEVCGQVGVTTNTSPYTICTPTGANAVRVAYNPALQQATPTPIVEANSTPPAPIVTPSVVPHQHASSSNETLLTSILQSFTDILSQNQRILQQVTPHARHNTPQQPLSC